MSNSKTLSTSLSARGLWVTAGSWSSAHLTDGVVPDQALASLGGTPELAAELVAAGLWKRRKNGWAFHDWTKKNPSKEAVEADRKAAARAGAAVTAGDDQGISVEHEPEIPVQLARLHLCDLCLNGEGEQCHTPGCSLFLNRPPDIGLRDNPSVTIGVDRPEQPAKVIVVAEAGGRERRYEADQWDEEGWLAIRRFNDNSAVAIYAPGAWLSAREDGTEVPDSAAVALGIARRALSEIYRSTASSAPSNAIANAAICELADLGYE